MADGARGRLRWWNPIHISPGRRIRMGRVENLFRHANRDDFVIVHLGGMYTLISPDGTQEMQFQDYVVPSSVAWRVVVRQLELWLERMKNESGGQ